MGKKNANYKSNEEVKTEKNVDGVSGSPTTKKIVLKCKNQEQKDFIKLIDSNEIILCNGPAGCGKSYLSIMKSLNYLKDDNKYKKIYIITPAVEISRSSVGFLPGSFSEKIAVYMNSVYRLFDKAIGEKNRKIMVEKNIIETLGLGYIRGENFDNCILIVDEAQNLTIKEMLTVLTRIGENCKMLISGDIMQTDKLRVEESGLNHAMKKLENIENIGIFTFSEDSIVRNSIISKILKKWN